MPEFEDYSLHRFSPCEDEPQEGALSPCEDEPQEGPFSPVELSQKICTSCKKPLSENSFDLGCCGYCLLCDSCVHLQPKKCFYKNETIESNRELAPLNTDELRKGYLNCLKCGYEGNLLKIRDHLESNCQCRESFERFVAREILPWQRMLYHLRRMDDKPSVQNRIRARKQRKLLRKMKRTYPKTISIPITDKIYALAKRLNKVGASLSQLTYDSDRLLEQLKKCYELMRTKSLTSPDVFNAHLNLTTMDDNFYDWKSLVLNEWMDQLVLFDQDHQASMWMFIIQTFLKKNQASKRQYRQSRSVYIGIAVKFVSIIHCESFIPMDPLGGHYFALFLDHNKWKLKKLLKIVLLNKKLNTDSEATLKDHHEQQDVKPKWLLQVQKKGFRVNILEDNLLEISEVTEKWSFQHTNTNLNHSDCVLQNLKPLQLCVMEQKVTLPSKVQRPKCQKCEDVPEDPIRVHDGEVYCRQCIRQQGFYERIEGDRIQRRDLEKYVCPYCKQFAEDPVTASCTHSYCRACSKEMEKGPTINHVAEMECSLGERCKKKKITRFYESLAIRTQQGHYFYVCPVTGDRITLGNIKGHQRDCCCLPTTDQS